jgi:hypothetical protein
MQNDRKSARLALARRRSWFGSIPRLGRPVAAFGNDIGTEWLYCVNSSSTLFNPIDRQYYYTTTRICGWGIFRSMMPDSISNVIETGGGYVVNIPIYSPFLHYLKSLILFLISFRLPLYYLETTDIFPTFFPSNMLPKNPYLTKGTLGTCSECIRNFPLLASHI